MKKAGDLAPVLKLAFSSVLFVLIMIINLQCLSFFAFQYIALYDETQSKFTPQCSFCLVCLVQFSWLLDNKFLKLVYQDHSKALHDF